LLLGAVVLVHSLFSSHGAEMRAATWPALLYLQNWAVPLHLGSPDATMWHTWSLATEEQFYLLWPAALPLIVARKSPVACIATMIVIMTIIRVAFWESNAPEWVLSQTLPIRPVGLFVGYALAFLPVSAWRASLAVQGVLLGSLLALSTFVSVSAIWTPLAVSLLTAGLISCLQGPSFLAAAPLRYIGKISYGLYLYHFPIMLAGKGHAPTLVLIGVSVVAAAVSYKYVEMPFLRLKDRRWGAHRPSNESANSPEAVRAA
jgi:peptidoglycan/LPS O-acetylase OafA/YrhL